MEEQNDASRQTEQMSSSRQQPASYPSPSGHAYPSPQPQPTYSYPAPAQAQVDGEAFIRHSPSSPNANQPPLNLPSIRNLDDALQSSASPAPSSSTLQQRSTPPISAPPAQIGVYAYPPPGQVMPPVGAPMGMAQNQHMMRYPIPTQDVRLMPSGRHKKEIKRRTKTGCLTCRKRRIKCDEEHPTCRNCQKSKRECLGYDPIFKQQTGPQQLQPAPSASPSSTPPTPAAPLNGNLTYSEYQPYTTGMSAPDGSVPLYGAHRDQRPFEFGAIDPVLSGTPGASHPPAYAAAGGMNAPLVPGPRKQERPLDVDELFHIENFGAYDTPLSTSPLPAAKLEEIKNLYNNDFAPGLDSLLETTWYSTVGIDRLMNNKQVCDMMAALIEHFRRPNLHEDPAATARVRATETKVVWYLLCLCRPSGATTNGTTGLLGNVDLDEANRRLDVLEYLLCNKVMSCNRVTEIGYPEDMPAEKRAEITFWTHVGTYVSTPRDSPTATEELDNALAQARGLLMAKENRDVIYSIMVCRHLGARFPSFPASLAPGPGGEENNLNKLFIAKSFITDQAVFKGTNHPVQRVCDMAIRSWAL
ncbi:hypothetical protein EJ06DRAFT_390107 [Trichodelitschia bisporula]|uniref:Zn(2)-C6 fungal-type domain-containing protein n=1 Tax=Trichodelitschia bisporula TaxID=703511 RepID=A0A6G1HZ98_9PEZI|nr:hypothetical protein EJ06DRAFT_390107 [Trichodelitschia bisporula]